MMWLRIDNTWAVNLDHVSSLEVNEDGHVVMLFHDNSAVTFGLESDAEDPAKLASFVREFIETHTINPVRSP